GRRFFTSRDAHESGLSGAIASDQAHAFAGIDLEIHAIENGIAAVAQREVAELKNGHVSGLENRRESPRASAPSGGIHGRNRTFRCRVRRGGFSNSRISPVNPTEFGAFPRRLSRRRWCVRAD